MHKLVNGVRVEMTAAEIAEHEATEAQAQKDKEQAEAARQALLEQKINSLKADGLSQTSIELLLPESKEYFENEGA